MSYPYLPAELLDDVVDLLQDRSEALKGCCLVAKSWIHRARRHLFARIALPDVASLQSWKTAFPDPSTSPACYTRSLGIKYPWDIMVEDTEEGSWIPAFSRVAYFELVIPTWARSDTDREMSLVPFHTFSPALRSIRVAVAADVPFLHVSNLIHSFSRLQDLAVITVSSFVPSHSPYTQLATTQPPSSLMFTGVLKLSLYRGMNPIASQLLSLPNTLHFRELRLELNQGDDIPLITVLVKRCSPTLENLEITTNRFDESQGPVDLSRAVKLNEAVFVFRWDPQWVTAIPHTLTSSHTNLRQILLHPCNIHCSLPPVPAPTDFRKIIGEAAYQGWLELDRLLTHLWESHSSRLKVLYIVPGWVDGENARRCTESLFPGVTVGGGWLTLLNAGMGNGEFGNLGVRIDTKELFGKLAGCMWLNCTRDLNTVQS